MSKRRKFPTKKQWIISVKKINKIIDHISEERGLEAEEKVKRVFCGERNPEWPVWLYSVRKAYEAEDFYHGIDFVARTDVGDIPIQIKSSESGASRFRNHPKYNPLTALIVINMGDTEEIVSTKVIIHLSRKRILIKNAKPS